MTAWCNGLGSIDDYQRRAKAARLLARIIGFGLCLLIGVPLAWELSKGFNCISGDQCHENDSYTEDFFRGLTPIAASLASRRTGDNEARADLQGFNCTFAVAALDHHAPNIPPTMRRSNRADMDWGGGWRSATALSAVDAENLRGLLAICSEYWTKDVQKTLLAAITDRRALVSGRAPYREVNLYLPPSDQPGLAARIRFGK